MVGTVLLELCQKVYFKKVDGRKKNLLQISFFEAIKGKEKQACCPRTMVQFWRDKKLNSTFYLAFLFSIKENYLEMKNGEMNMDKGKETQCTQNDSKRVSKSSKGLYLLARMSSTIRYNRIIKEVQQQPWNLGRPNIAERLRLNVCNSVILQWKKSKFHKLL